MRQKIQKTKIIFLAAILLLIIFSPIRYFALFLLYGLAVATLIYLSKVPLRFIFKRVAQIMPFIIIISISALFKKQGYILFLNCTIKAILSIVLILIASSTTKFNHLLKTLRQFKVPNIFIHLLSFMYRYSFLLEDEFLRASRAYQSRNINNKDNFSKVKIFSNILGTLFIRTYERAERVYLAMCSRGYDNEKSS